MDSCRLVYRGNWHRTDYREGALMTIYSFPVVSWA